MDPKKLSLSAAALALAAALGFVAGNQQQPAEPEAAPDVATEQLLDHATPKCVGLLRDHNANPECRIGEASRGLKTIAVDVDLPEENPQSALRPGDKVLSGKVEPGAKVRVSRRVRGDPEQGWICNGAWMPTEIQTCLNQALEAAAK